MMGGGWNDAKTAEAKRLWLDGFSASEVALRIGGVTRNSVIGKMSRLGLGRSAPVVPKAERPARPPRPRMTAARKMAKPGTVPALAAPVAASVPRPWTERPPRGCKWPVGGDGADLLSCCAPRDGERPYCVEHCAIAFLPPRDRRVERLGRLA